MKDIEKYIGYYLLVYLGVLSVCGFFQYMAVCQGKTLECAFSMNGINTIITTTAYVVTPIVAIIGFMSWKSQHNLKIHSESAKEILALFEEAFYKLLTFENTYKLFQFEVEKIIKSDDEMPIKIQKSIEVYKEFESIMNLNLLDVESKIEWVLFRVTSLSIIIKSDDLLSITLETRKNVNELLKPIREQKNKKMSSKEFYEFYGKIAQNSIAVANKNIAQVIIILNKYIEA